MRVTLKILSNFNTLFKVFLLAVLNLCTAGYLRAEASQTPQVPDVLSVDKHIAESLLKKAEGKIERSWSGSDPQRELFIYNQLVKENNVWAIKQETLVYLKDSHEVQREVELKKFSTEYPYPLISYSIQETLYEYETYKANGAPLLSSRKEYLPKGTQWEVHTESEQGKRTESIKDPSFNLIDVFGVDLLVAKSIATHNLKPQKIRIKTSDYETFEADYLDCELTLKALLDHEYFAELKCPEENIVAEKRINKNQKKPSSAETLIQDIFYEPGAHGTRMTFADSYHMHSTILNTDLVLSTDKAFSNQEDFIKDIEEDGLPQKNAALIQAKNKFLKKPHQIVHVQYNSETALAESPDQKILSYDKNTQQYEVLWGKGVNSEYALNPEAGTSDLCFASDKDLPSEWVDELNKLINTKQSDEEKLKIVLAFVQSKIPVFDRERREKDDYKSLSFAEIKALEKGTCIDYSNLAAALLRTIGIPAKRINGHTHPFRSGYDRGAHAVIEAYLDGRWKIIEPQASPSEIFVSQKPSLGTTTEFFFKASETTHDGEFENPVVPSIKSFEIH